MADPNKIPVLVTEAFTPEQMQKLIEVVKSTNGLPKNAVFGVVTPNNRRWRLSQLLEELRREQTQAGRPPR